MKAAVYSADGSINLKQVDIPELKPGWLQIAVNAVGICGTDLHIKSGALGSPENIRPGHEIAGVVEVIGDDVNLAVGTAVAIEPVFGCGQCQHCISGSPNRCATKDFFGYSQPGGLAELIHVPESIVYPHNSNLSANVSALTEPMAVCVRGAIRAKISIGSRVAILGAGSIGLLSILSAYAAGASEVFISARHQHQQEIAKHLGASRVFTDSDKLLKELGDQYIDVVIETVGGTATTLSDSILITKTGGTILMLGAFTGTPVIPAMRFLTNELSLVASNCHGHEGQKPDFEIACELVERYSEQLELLITHQFKLDQIAEAFATAEDKNQLSIKVQVSP